MTHFNRLKKELKSLPWFPTPENEPCSSRVFITFQISALPYRHCIWTTFENWMAHRFLSICICCQAIKYKYKSTINKQRQRMWENAPTKVHCTWSQKLLSEMFARWKIYTTSCYVNHVNTLPLKFSSVIKKIARGQPNDPQSLKRFCIVFQIFGPLVYMNQTQFTNLHIMLWGKLYSQEDSWTNHYFQSNISIDSNEKKKKRSNESDRRSVSN